MGKNFVSKFKMPKVEKKYRATPGGTPYKGMVFALYS